MIGLRIGISNVTATTIYLRLVSMVFSPAIFECSLTRGKFGGKSLSKRLSRRPSETYCVANRFG